MWKVQIKEGDVLEKKHLIAILEAMKMEINVYVEDKFVGRKVKKVAQTPGSIVSPGDPLCFLE